MSDQSTVVLGGGLAGLVASMYLGAPVYEADDHPGGVANSDTVDGFTFDRGIHILQTKNQFILDLLGELGVEFRCHARNAYIYSHGCYTPYPFQVNTAGLPVGLRAHCAWQFLLRNRNPEPNNYEEWMYRALGKGFARTFLIPYSEKFWTVHPREMTYEWTGARVPQPTLGQVLRGAVWSKATRIGTNVDFRYPQTGGYGVIARALRGRAGSMHCGYRATKLDAARRRISFSNGASVAYETLISSIPLPDLIRICPEAPDEVRTAVAKLWTNSIFVVNLGIGRPNLSSKHWVHFPEKDVSFFRISYPHNFGTDVAPPGMSSISAEVAYSAHAPLERESIVDRVVEDLIRVGALGKSDPIILKTTYDIKHAYCVYDHARKEALRPVREWLAKVGIVPCGRYGLWTYFWSDEAMLSGKMAAENVVKSRDGKAEEVAISE